MIAADLPIRSRHNLDTGGLEDVAPLHGMAKSVFARVVLFAVILHITSHASEKQVTKEVSRPGVVSQGLRDIDPLVCNNFGH